MVYVNTQLSWNVIKHAMCLLYRTGPDRQPAINSRNVRFLFRYDSYITVVVTDKNIVTKFSAVLNLTVRSFIMFIVP